MDPFEISRAGPDDWRRLRAVRLRALADAPDAFGTTLEQEEARPTAQWRTRLEVEANATFLASQGGSSNDVGLAVGTPWEFGNENAAGLFAMWVAPEARGAGVGDALVDAVAAWARAAGYARILLDVADANAPAIALYARKGFTPTGKTGTLPPPRENILEHERVLVL